MIPIAMRVTAVIEIWGTVFNFLANTFLSAAHVL